MAAEAKSSEPQLHVHASKDELSTAVGEHVSKSAIAAVAARGTFSVALSGGSLPKLLAKGLLAAYKQLTPEELKEHCSKWHVFFADERIVELTASDSNFKTCQDEFLAKLPIPRDNVYTIDPSLAPVACAAAYEATLKRVLGDEGEMDMALLGMGPDGHTCSLFPGHALLQETKLLVASIEDSPKPPPQRVTLTFPVLHKARQVCFVAAGGSKAENLPKVLKGELPAGKARSASGATHWFVDKDAAAKL